MSSIKTNRGGVSMEKIIAKAYVEKISDEEGILEAAIGSSESMDREGDIIKASGWQTDNFNRNPVLLWAHNVHELRPPIGKVKRLWVEDDRLMFQPEFDLEDEFAAAIYRKYKKGYLNSFSVGFLPIERDGKTYLAQELLEISAVPVPANADANVALRSKGFKTKTWEELTVEAKWEDRTKEVVDEYKELAMAFKTLTKEHIKLQHQLVRGKKKVRDDPKWTEVKDLITLLNQTTSKVLRKIKTERW